MQEYEITSIDVGREPFIDQNGNTWVTAVFLGVGEPVKWVVKDPTKFKVGDKVYGSIKEVPTKKDPNKFYQRFYREAKPETHEPNQSDEYWDERNRSIRAQWAIGQAVSYWNNLMPLADRVNKDLQDVDFIEKYAKEFFAMVDRVAQDPNDIPIVNRKD